MHQLVIQAIFSPFSLLSSSPASFNRLPGLGVRVVGPIAPCGGVPLRLIGGVGVVISILFTPPPMPPSSFNGALAHPKKPVRPALAASCRAFSSRRLSKATRYRS